MFMIINDLWHSTRLRRRQYLVQKAKCWMTFVIFHTQLEVMSDADATACEDAAVELIRRVAAVYS
jgi:hypothetical protein